MGNEAYWAQNNPFMQMSQGLQRGLEMGARLDVQQQALAMQKEQMSYQRQRDELSQDIELWQKMLPYAEPGQSPIMHKKFSDFNNYLADKYPGRFTKLDSTKIDTTIPEYKQAYGELTKAVDLWQKKGGSFMDVVKVYQDFTNKAAQARVTGKYDKDIDVLEKSTKGMVGGVAGGIESEASSLLGFMGTDKAYQTPEVTQFAYGLAGDVGALDSSRGRALRDDIDRLSRVRDKESGITGNKQADLELAYMKRFTDDPVVKDYKTIQQNYGRMSSAYEKVKEGKLKGLNFLDQTLITVFNKTLDPGSVVRESEYARTPEGLALMNRAQGYFERLQKGGAGLTDDDRKDALEIAMQFADIQREAVEELKASYRPMLQEKGIKERNVFLIPEYKRNLKVQPPAKPTQKGKADPLGLGL